MLPAESPTPTPWGVHCHGIDPEVGAGPCNDGNIIYLIEAAYVEQLSNAYAFWHCPRCGANASWDDANYEAAIDASDVELA